MYIEWSYFRLCCVYCIRNSIELAGLLSTTFPSKTLMHNAIVITSNSNIINVLDVRVSPYFYYLCTLLFAQYKVLPSSY